MVASEQVLRQFFRNSAFDYLVGFRSSKSLVQEFKIGDGAVPWPVSSHLVPQGKLVGNVPVSGMHSPSEECKDQRSDSEEEEEKDRSDWNGKTPRDVLFQREAKADELEYS